MPRAKPCAANCGRLITTGSRCTNCQHPRQRNGWQWTITRHQILDRDDYRCQHCGSTHQLEIHHRQPLADGGTDQASNLLTLCHDCHLEEN